MQIIPFPAHYQSVYTNFDISSFSLINCSVIYIKLGSNLYQIVRQYALYCPAILNALPPYAFSLQTKLARKDKAINLKKKRRISILQLYLTVFSGGKE